MSALVTNLLDCELHYPELNNDFDFFEIKTSGKYIKSGADVLDVPKMHLHAKSIVFESGKQLYVMFEKNHIDSNSLKKGMLVESEDDLQFQKVSCQNIPGYLLVQLILNSLNSPSSNGLSFNNITGKLICYRGSWLSYGRNGEIWSLNCLEIKIRSNYALDLLAHSLTSVKLKKRMEFGKTKFEDYPQYVFTNSNMSFRRVLNHDTQQEEKFIMKPILSTKASITFIDFSDYKRFESCKVGVVYDLLENIKRKLSKYINIDLRRLPISQTIHCSSRELKYYWVMLEDELEKNGINIIDTICNNSSQLVLDELENRIKSIFPRSLIARKKRSSKRKQNIILIHNKEYYVDGMDPHDNATGLVQHITLEDFLFNSRISLENVLKELGIKLDISRRKITLQNWTQYNFPGYLKFIVKSENNQIVVLKIDSVGNCEFETIELSLFNIGKFETYYKALNIGDGESNNKVLGLVEDHLGNVNSFVDSGLFTLPNVVALGTLVNKMKNEFLLEGSYLQSVLSKQYSDVESTELCKIVASIDPMKSYTRNDIKKFSTNRKILTRLDRIIYEDTGELLNLYLRNTESRDALFSGIVDISVYSESDNCAYYSVGVIGSGMKSSIEKASKIRMIKSLDNSRLLIDEVIQLMNVEFVQYGRLTVTPFPFKYLNEYIKFNKRK